MTNAKKSVTAVKPPPSAKPSNEAPSIDELDAIVLPSYGLVDGKVNHVHTSLADSSPRDEQPTPQTPHELERSQPPTPKQDEAAGIMPTFWYPQMNRWRVLSATAEYFANGLNDSAPGPLIPYIETWYNIGYAVVSTIWISNAVGFILAAFLSDLICARLGRARSLMYSELCIMVAYAVIACPVPFPVVVVAYMFVGFGEALEIALNTVFCANLANSTVILGAAVGLYGVGGVLGPIMATALVTNGVHWSLFYAIAIAFRAINLAAVGWSFWGFEKDGAFQFSNNLERITSRQATADTGPASKLKQIGQALKSPTTLIGAFFIFAYQGAEVAEAGWVTTYLIDYRHGDPAHVGYVTAGFWAGIAIGRFVLTHVATRVGEKIFVFSITVGCIVFQLLIWFVPSIVGESVAVAIVGLLIGPVYPCAQSIFARLLPGSLQVFAIGFISSMGSSGGAVVPFLTGLVAQSAGTFVLHPICIFCFVCMLASWGCLPRQAKRRE